MSVELLQTLSLGSYVLAAIMLIISIYLFFKFDVLYIIGDISGVNQRKGIEEIRLRNERTGDKAYKPSPINVARGKLTEKITPSGRLESRGHNFGGSVQTEKLDTTDLTPTTPETTVLSSVVNGEGKTTVLAQQTEQELVSNGGEFSLDVEMGFSGSSEVIE